jgi:hypothetical protein
MSTPIPPKLKLEVHNLYAPRRAHRPAADESVGSPPWARRHSDAQHADAQDDEQQEAGQEANEAEERAPVGPGSVQVAQERLDDAIRQAVEIANLHGEEEQADDAETEADYAEAEAGYTEADYPEAEVEDGEEEPDDGEPRLPPAPTLRTPQSGAAGRLSAAADPRWPGHDTALAAARRRRSLEPEIVPEPPSGGELRMAPLLLRFGLVVGFAAIAAYAVTMIGPLQSRLLPAAVHTADNPPETVMAQDRSAVVAQDRSAVVAQDHSAALENPPQLLVQSKQSFANEPVELGISVDHGSGQESLLLAGLTAGTRLSAGAPIGNTRWELALNDLHHLYMYAPKDFVGVMNAAVDLLSPTAQLLDTKAVQFAWIARAAEPPVERIAPPPKTAPIQPKDLAQEALMMKRGEDLLDIGDIAGARRVFQYLADAGNADGALAMGATFDARFLAARNAIGVVADDAKARSWYRRAMELGSAQAKTLLAQMTDQ